MESARDEVFGEDDIIEVELADIQGLDGDWDQHVMDSNVVFMRA